jgi:hypothetical protein
VWSPLPTPSSHGRDQGSPEIGIVGVGACPQGLPLPWEPVRWRGSQGAEMSPNVQSMLLNGGGVCTSTPKGHR